MHILTEFRATTGLNELSGPAQLSSIPSKQDTFKRCRFNIGPIICDAGPALIQRLKLCLATASDNIKRVKLSHICLI